MLRFERYISRGLIGHLSITFACLLKTTLRSAVQ